MARPLAVVAAPRGRGPAVLALGALVFIGFAFAIRLPLLGSGELDYDEGVYWESLRSLAAGHPIYASVFSSQPPAFLLLLEPPWAALGGSIAAARLVILAWGLVAVASGALIGWRLLGPCAGAILAVLLAADPLMLRQSVVLQAEGPAIACGLLAMACASVAVTTNRKPVADAAAFASGAALAVGILTKLFDVAVIPPLIALVALNSHPLRRASMLIVGTVVAGALVLIPLHDAWGAMWDQAVGLHLTSSSLDIGRITDPGFIAALTRETPVLALAVVGVFLGIRGFRVETVVGLAWLAGGLAALAATHPTWPHHAVVLAPAANFLAAIGVVEVGRRLLNGRNTWTKSVVAALAAVPVAGLLLIGLLAMPAGANLDGIVAAIDRQTAPGAPLLGDEQFAAAAAARDAPPAYVDTSFTRLLTMRTTAAVLEQVLVQDHVCAVLFATGRLAQVPGFFEAVRQSFPDVTDLGGGRRLFSRPGC